MPPLQGHLQLQQLQEGTFYSHTITWHWRRKFQDWACWRAAIDWLLQCT